MYKNSQTQTSHYVPGYSRLSQSDIFMICKGMAFCCLIKQWLVIILFAIIHSIIACLSPNTSQFQIWLNAFCLLDLFRILSSKVCLLDLFRLLSSNVIRFSLAAVIRFRNVLNSYSVGSELQILMWFKLDFPASLW